MKELSPQKIAAAEEAMQAQRHEMTRVADFINKPIKNKNGTEKSPSMHMKIDYVACAIDELYERTRNSICMHVSQIHTAISDLYKRVEKLEGKSDETPNNGGANNDEKCDK